MPPQFVRHIGSHPNGISVFRRYGFEVGTEVNLQYRATPGHASTRARVPEHPDGTAEASLALAYAGYRAWMRNRRLHFPEGRRHALLLEILRYCAEAHLLECLPFDLSRVEAIKKLQAFADRGYFSGQEIKACEDVGVTPFVPKPMTSSAKADGRFSKADFIYVAKDDEYECPAGERAIHRFTTIEHDLKLHVYWSSACPRCPMREQCTITDYRRIRRWEHEVVIERMQKWLDRMPDAMTLRRRTIEHVFGTLKHWMGSTHFLTKTLEHVSTEMSLHVLAYNLKRVIRVLGIAKMMKAVKLAGA